MTQVLTPAKTRPADLRSAKRSTLARQDRRFGLWIAMPAVAAFVTIIIYPVISSVVTSLFNQSLLVPARSFAVTAKIPELASDKFQIGFQSAVSNHARAAAWDKLTAQQQIDTIIGAGVAGILAGQTDVQAGLNALKTQVQSALDAANK